MDTFRVDEEFRSLIPPMTEGERAGLEAKLQAEGCRESLIVWKNDPAGASLIDGHHRSEICGRLNIPYRVVEMEFADKAQVRVWMLSNQLGRRNLSDDQRAAFAFMLAEEESAILKRERAQAGRAAGGAATPEQEQERLSAHCADKRSDEPKPKRDTRAEAAKSAKVPESKLRSVSQLAKSNPADVQKIAKGEKTIREAKREAKEKEPAAPEPVPVDLAGNPIHSAPIRTAFANSAAHHKPALDLLTQLSALLNPIMGDGKDRAPIAGGEHTSAERAQMQVDIRNLRTSLTQTRPHGVCPYCVGRDKKCNACKGLGWVVKATYERAPEDMRIRLKNHAA